MKCLVDAGSIKAGHCFRKSQGSFAYLRMSEWSVKFLNDPAFVYGVCYNGNITKVTPETKVAKLPLSAVIANLEHEREWEDAVGVIRSEADDR